MVGWHHWFSGHEFGFTSGVGDGQGGLHAAVHGVAKSRTRLSDGTELKPVTFAYALEMEIVIGLFVN